MRNCGLSPTNQHTLEIGKLHNLLKSKGNEQNEAIR